MNRKLINITLIFILIIVKLIIVALLSLSLDISLSEVPIPIIISHDAISYIKAASNIYYYGTYTLSNLPHEVPVPYTGRMGGYELMIAFFMLFGTVENALIYLVVFQMLVSALSIYALAGIAKEIFNNNILYWITFVLYLINTYVTIFDISVLSESLSVSFLIISIYLMVQQNNKSINYVLSGLTFCFSIFLRPYLVLIIPAVVYYIYNERKTIFTNRRIRLVHALLFLLPFVVGETIWIGRNYFSTGKFIPLVSDLHAGIEYPDGFSSLMIFVQYWGGDIVWWNPKAEIVAFINEPAIRNVQNRFNNIDELPAYIFTTVYNRDSLNKIKNYLSIEADSTVSKETRRDYGKKASLMLKEYSKSFRDEKPIHYYLFAPLRLFYHFVLHSGTYNISSKAFSEMNLQEKVFKLLYSFLYIFTLTTGIISLSYCLWKRTNPAIILAAYAGLLMIILCPFILRRIEYRYFITSYPFLSIFAAYFIWQVGSYIKTRRLSV